MIVTELRLRMFLFDCATRGFLIFAVQEELAEMAFDFRQYLLRLFPSTLLTLTQKNAKVCPILKAQSLFVFNN